jgi:hypothetical protein
VGLRCCPRARNLAMQTAILYSMSTMMVETGVERRGGTRDVVLCFGARGKPDALKRISGENTTFRSIHVPNRLGACSSTNNFKERVGGREAGEWPRSFFPGQSHIHMNPAKVFSLSTIQTQLALSTDTLCHCIPKHEDICSVVDPASAAKHFQ